MKQAYLTLLLLLGLTAPSLRAAQIESYHLISGTVSNPPPINAVTVENVGNVTLFNSIDVLFDFQNMQNFANRQLIISTPGIEFDNFNPDNYLRTPLASFINENTIQASLRLLISADSVVNTDNALLQTGRGGKIAISGNTVNLQGGRLSSGDGAGFGNVVEGDITIRRNNGFYYINPLNIRDDYWGSTNGGNLSLSFLSQGGVTPSHLVQLRGNPAGVRYINSLDVNPNSFSSSLFLTNFFSTNGYLCFMSTNDINFANNTIFKSVQVVFIRTNQFSPDIQVSFSPSTNSANYPINDIAVQFGTSEVDPITGQTFQRYLTLLDESGFRARLNNGGPSVNLSLQANDDRPGYARPLGYTLIRSDFPFLFGFSSAPVAYTNVIFPGSGNFNERFITNLVDHEYSAYGFTVSPRDFGGDLGLDPVLSDPTNSTGRVEINARDLNITYATIKAENLLSLTGTNGISLIGANLIAPTVSLKIPGTSDLTISNNFPDTVVRLNGQVAVWTGVYQIDQRVTNTTWLPGYTGNVAYAYQVMVIDNTLVTNTPVQVRDFTVQAATVTVDDSITFGGNFSLGGTSLIIPTNGIVTFAADNPDFTAQDGPNLKNLVNQGQFNVPGLLSLGFDRPLAYTNISNSGLMQAGSIQIRSDIFTNSGTMSSLAGGITINSASNFLQGGVMVAGAGNLDLSGNHLSLTGAVLFTSQKLNLRFTNFLGDNGVTNQIIVNDGFRLLSHPNKGDLMATHVTSTATSFQNRFHTWAGEDRGATPSGYANNTAIQQLTLNGGPGSTFFFQGATTGNALYVNYLEFLGSTTNGSGVHIPSTLNISPNLTIYFADSNVPEDKLTNAFPGRLVWVDSSITVGPMVAVPTTAGQYVSLTTRAAQLMLAPGGDADGDGIENERDPSPLSGFTVSNVSVVNLPPLTAFIKWQARQGILYTVEYRETLDSSTWKTLYSITADENREVTAIDVPPGGSQRFYRVRFTLN